jgi:hypothetical protein
MAARAMNRWLLATALVVLALAAVAAVRLRVRPRHDREWATDQRLLPAIGFDGSRMTIRNVRDFDYVGADVIENYEDRVYDLDALESVWYVLVPFSRDWRGPAHSFLSFGFTDGRHLAISVEARRELGETYSLIGGMLRRFEIMYVVGDERDLIKMRALQRGDDVYVYPIRTAVERARSVLVAMLERANAIAERPEFYHTLTNNCMTNILRHVNDVAERRIRYGWRVLLPGHTDELAYRRGLIDTELGLHAARERFNVSRRVARWADAADFSLRIREVEDS